MRIKKFGVFTSAVLALSLGLSGCTSANGGNSSSTAESVGAVSPVEGDLPVVDGTFGERPTIHPATGAEPKQLVAKVLVSGNGAEVKASDTLTVNYAGQLWDGKPFDSSFNRGEPAQFPLNGVIPGWTKGLTGKHVGDRVLLVIPSDLGYGDQGKPPTIPAKATLVFVVDIVAATSAEEAKAQSEKKAAENKAKQDKIQAMLPQIKTEGAAAVAAATVTGAGLPSGLSTDNNQKAAPSLKADENVKSAAVPKPIILLQGKGPKIGKDNLFFARLTHSFAGDTNPATTSDNLVDVDAEDPAAADFLNQNVGSRVLRVLTLGDGRTMAQIVDIMGIADKNKLK